MRGRKPGLLPIERSILETGIELRRDGAPEFHGFLAASRMRDTGEARMLTSRGTLYKALDRLERQGFLASRWEDPDVALLDGRPRRRLYHVTPAGELALSSPRVPSAAGARRLQSGGASS
ncbi:MAG: helix-turn-helix transcriptional regulator [Chloroflexi bacterium]|nr:helix-turn-helix transcriptional regulator [Chloroflexota bacterium]